MEGVHVPTRRKKTAVAISTPPDGKRITTCPACGYPTLGGVLCAACILISAAAQIDLAIDIFDGASGSNPAA